MTSNPRPIEPGVSIGHVHLKVADLNRALAFYLNDAVVASVARAITRDRHLSYFGRGLEPASPTVPAATEEN